MDRHKIQLQEELGQGEFGVVLRAIATELPNCEPLLCVAVKVMRQGQDQSAKNAFIRESMRQKDLDHPNVVRMLAVCLVAEPYMIILEYMSFGDLKSLLRRCKANATVLTLSHYCSFLKDLCAALDYLHSRRFVHRDIAARNVLISGSLTAKIGDFGQFAAYYVIFLP